MLEGSVDSQYRIGDPVWDIINVRGYDAGLNLKTTNGWNGNDNGTDLFGFSGLPGGLRDDDSDLFIDIGNYGHFGTSMEFSINAWHRSFSYDYPGVYRFKHSKELGFSVRCLMNY